MKTPKAAVIWVMLAVGAAGFVQGAERLSAKAVTDLMSGNTATYKKKLTSVDARWRGKTETTTYDFLSDGALEAVYEAEGGRSVRQGKWWVKDDGALCVETPEEKWCNHVAPGDQGTYNLYSARDGTLKKVFRMSGR